MIELLVRLVSLICRRDPLRTHLVIRWIGFDDDKTRDAVTFHTFTRTEQE